MTNPVKGFETRLVPGGTRRISSQHECKFHKNRIAILLFQLDGEWIVGDNDHGKCAVPVEHLLEVESPVEGVDDEGFTCTYDIYQAPDGEEYYVRTLCKARLEDGILCSLVTEEPLYIVRQNRTVEKRFDLGSTQVEWGADDLVKTGRTYTTKHLHSDAPPTPELQGESITKVVEALQDVIGKMSEVLNETSPGEDDDLESIFDDTFFKR